MGRAKTENMNRTKGLCECVRIKHESASVPAERYFPTYLKMAIYFMCTQLFYVTFLPSVRHLMNFQRASVEHTAYGPCLWHHFIPFSLGEVASADKAIIIWTEANYVRTLTVISMQNSWCVISSDELGLMRYDACLYVCDVRACADFMRAKASIKGDVNSFWFDSMVPKL